MNIDPNLANRINFISKVTQIQELSPKSVMNLTNDFEESHVRFLISKFSVDDQKEVFEAIEKAFDNVYFEGYDFGQPIYSKEVPLYFGKLKLDIELNIPINIEERLAENYPIEMLSTVSGIIEASNTACSSLGIASNFFEQSLQNIQTTTNNCLEQIKAFKDSAVSNLSKKLQDEHYRAEHLAEQISMLSAENQELKLWQANWEELRQKVVSEMFDTSDVKECGSIDDPTLMHDAICAIFDQNAAEQKLKEENERLRKEQEAWRERPEYKAEIEKYEQASKQYVSIEQIKKGLARVAQLFGKTDQFSNFLLYIGHALRETAWDQVPSEFTDNLITKFNIEHQPQSTINVTEKGNIIQKVEDYHESPK